MKEKIGVIGAGSWGTTLADLLAKKGHDVTLWAHEPEVAQDMAGNGVNSLFLPGIQLSPRLRFTNSLHEAAADKDMLLFVVPSQVVRGVIKTIIPSLRPGAMIVSASKGIELETLMIVSQIYEELLPPDLYRNFAALSGPTFARGWPGMCRASSRPGISGSIPITM
jgi:glycerol-3-phosphate dehydrogenase (NAD(P)+)